MENTDYLGCRDLVGSEINFRDSVSDYHLNEIQEALNQFLLDKGYKQLSKGHVYAYVTSRKFTAWMRVTKRKFDLYEINSYWSRDFIFYFKRLALTSLRYSMGPDVDHVRIRYLKETDEECCLMFKLEQLVSPVSYLRIEQVDEIKPGSSVKYIGLFDDRE